MKTIISTCFVLLLCTGTFAQYKKASFLSKEGRTYGLGAQMYNMKDGIGSVMGYNIAFGRDQDGKRLFNFWEIRLIPSFDFSYRSKDYSDQMVTVNGSSKVQLVYALNYAYHILPNEGKRVVQPFVTAGINIAFLGGVKEVDRYDVNKLPADRNLNIGFAGGAGTLVNLGANFSLKLEGGYSYVWNWTDIQDSEYKPFFLYTSHAYASAGIRYRLVED